MIIHSQYDFSRWFFLSLILLFFCVNESKSATNWQCKAVDAEHKEWYAQGDYQLSAINKAFDSCKKESNLPQSCKTSKEGCEMMMDGILTMRPMWQCMALDLAATAWFSNVYDHAADAVLAALAYCRTYSSLPTTCYIDPFVCRDLNARSF